MNRMIEFIKSNQEYFENIITRSTYHSNGIEGSTLSYAETYALLFNDNSLSINATPRELYEAINHKRAMNYLFEHVEEPLSQEMIKQLGILVNKNISDVDGYRKVQVMIRGAEHVPPRASEVPQAMMYFVYNLDHTEYESIFDKIADMHIQYERIHPFPDGNGRTGRLLINYELLREEYAPIVIPKEERTRYFNLLAACDRKGMAAFFRDLEQKEVELLEKFGYEPEPHRNITDANVPKSGTDNRKKEQEHHAKVKKEKRPSVDGRYPRL